MALFGRCSFSSGYARLRAWKDSTAWQHVAVVTRCWYRSWIVNHWKSPNPSLKLFQTVFSPRFSRFGRSTTRHLHPRKFMFSSPLHLVVSRKSHVLHSWTQTHGLGAVLWMTAIAAEASVPWRGSLNWKKVKRCYGWTGSGSYWRYM